MSKSCKQFYQQQLNKKALPSHCRLESVLNNVAAFALVNQWPSIACGAARC